MSSIKEHCCGADSMFDMKTANKQYKHFLKKGPSRVTSTMIGQLSNHVDFESSKTMIDVGGGVGALQWWFLKAGGAKTTSVDASSAYIRKAKEHAAGNNWADQVHFVMGDVADVKDQIEPADLITLDKVVCCYPDYKTIINVCCDKSKSLASLSYPMDGIISNLIANIGALFTRFKTKTFRPYVHPVRDIRKEFERLGFERVSHSLSFPWHIETYKRVHQNFTADPRPANS